MGYFRILQLTKRDHLTCRCRFAGTDWLWTSRFPVTGADCAGAYIWWVTVGWWRWWAEEADSCWFKAWNGFLSSKSFYRLCHATAVKHARFYRFIQDQSGLGGGNTAIGRVPSFEWRTDYLKKILLFRKIWNYFEINFPDLPLPRRCVYIVYSIRAFL